MGLAGFSALMLGAAVAANALPIEGDLTCPAPADVTAKLHHLVNSDSVGQPGDRIRLVRGADALQVALVRGDGQVRGLRSLDLGHDCEELAEAAAVIVASWQTAAPARAAAAPDSPPPGPARPTAGLALAAPAPLDLAAARAAAFASAPAWRANVGLGLAGAMTTGTAAAPVAPGLILEATLARAGGALGLHLRGLLTASHTQALPNGEVSWRRWPVSLGPSWSWRTGRLALEVDASAGAAWLHVQGQGFAENQDHNDVDFGGSAGARLAFGAARPPAWRPWVGTGAGFWPRRTATYQVPDQSRSYLPRWEWWFEIGVGRESR